MYYVGFPKLMIFDDHVLLTEIGNCKELAILLLYDNILRALVEHVKQFLLHL